MKVRKKDGTLADYIILLENQLYFVSLVSGRGAGRGLKRIEELGPGIDNSTEL